MEEIKGAKGSEIERKTSMRTDILLHLIKFFRSVVAQIVVTVAPESNGTWNENQKEKYVIERLRYLFGT